MLLQESQATAWCPTPLPAQWAEALMLDPHTPRRTPRRCNGHGHGHGHGNDNGNGNRAALHRIDKGRVVDN